MGLSRFCLIVSADGLLPIARSYGLDPNRILPKLFQFHPVEGDTVHVLRPIMGLYFATIILWLLGAIRGGPMMRMALIGEIVFMSGLAAGRLLDILIDGWPSPVLIVYPVTELLLAAWGVLCLRRFDGRQNSPYAFSSFAIAEQPRQDWHYGIIERLECFCLHRLLQPEPDKTIPWVDWFFFLPA